MADFARRQTAAEIVQEACALQGLPVPGSVATNPVDVTAKQMWALLRTAGRRLCKPTNTHRWQVLTRLWNLDTVPGETLYTLPDDFDSFEDITAWNYTSQLPMLGPATDSQWQVLKARNMGPSTLSVVYRTAGGRFEIYNAFDSVQQLRINYTSRAWVLADTSPPLPAPQVYRDQPINDGDLVLFDPELMVCALQRAFMTAKGFDTTNINAEYNSLLEAAICADQDAPVLNLAPSSGFPLINPMLNAPDTGYGG